MSIEVRPVGVSCNIRCDYCYEEKMRESNPVNRYQPDAVKASIAKLPQGSFFSLFGGEPLLITLPQLEELLKLACDKAGSSGLQTNGNLVTEAHIDLFRTYKTGVGISLDGDGILNDIRWAGNLEATREHTDRSMWAIRRLCEEAKTTPHLLPSIICTLHAGNCSQERFPLLVEWFKQLDAWGIRHCNLHVMEMDHKANQWYLSQDELSDRLIDLWNLQDSFTQLRFSKFHEILSLLQGDDNVVCTWRACDPWNTSAVQGIENDGSPSHCSRTNKDGKNWLPAEGAGDPKQSAVFIGHPGARFHERQLALYVTPQEVGGCKDCPYWLMCLGQCPGEGEHGDWRERSHYCHTYKKLFAEGERRMRLAGQEPLTDWSHRHDLETWMYKLWTNGESPQLGFLVRNFQKYNTGQQFVSVENGNYHGDAHGDAHGDHTDLN
jgi:uncharacterized protein